MSEMQESHSAESSSQRETPPLTVVPVPYPPRPRPSVLNLLFRWLFRMMLGLSLGVNVLLLFLVIGLIGDGSNVTLHERYHSGSTTASDRIAVINVDGVLMEGMMGYAQKQIEQAAGDNHVKAVVLRIESPGGTITASDDLHRRLRELRDGNPAKSTQSKPMVVSMGSVAASGGYYIAMPAKTLFAERTTITGSIGVYAAFPNVADLANKYGVKMNVIKAGDVKDSGSMFKEMTPQERELWQEMVNHAYGEFIAVVEEGRPELKGKLRDIVIERPLQDDAGKEKTDGTKYIRRRADGGIFTADQAKEFKLIDEIGYLDDAIAEAKKLAGPGRDYKVITYDPPQTFMSTLLGVKAPQTGVLQLDPARMASGASPRLWYMAPQGELAGFLAAMGESQN